MIEIPFTKLHGAENDFLLTWGDEAPQQNGSDIARRICARTTGIGADGWMLVWLQDGHLHTRLFNPDGSEAEISGNGTRCAAAFGLINRVVSPPNISIATGALSGNQPFWIRFEYRVEESESSKDPPDNSGFTLTGLIDIFSRRTRPEQVHGFEEAGPLRLENLKRG